MNGDEVLYAIDSSTHSSRRTPVYSVVVPVYRNEPTIGALLEELVRLSTALDGEMEAVFVVDGSPDQSFAILHRELRSVPFSSQLIAHSRNFGSYAAIRTGFNAACGSYVAVMAADLQEPIELVAKFFQHLRSGDYDIAVGTREARSDPLFSRVSSNLFWRFYRICIDRNMPKGGVDVFACSRPVVDQLSLMQEAHSSLVGLLFWLGFRRVEVPYIRAKRAEGTSGWTLSKKIRYLTDSIFSFTDLPIILLAIVGFVGCVVTVLVAITITVARFTGAIHASGYTPLMLVILLSTFMLILALGIVGSYVWRTYENGKSRPASISMAHERFIVDIDGQDELQS